MDKRYFLYRHVRKDMDEVFYIGVGTEKPKGLKENTKYYRAYSVSGRSSLWKSIANKTSYTVEIIFSSNDLKLIAKKEIEFIALYKRRSDGGTLANHSTGGESSGMGVKPSEETKLKLSKASKGKKISQETKNKMSKSHLGKLVSKETGRKISQSKIGKPGRKLSQEGKEKIRQARLGNKMSKETKDKLSRANKGKSLSDDHKLKMSISQGKRRLKEALLKVKATFDALGDS